MRSQGVSQRRACKAIGQARTTQRYKGSDKSEKECFREKVIEFSLRYNRYGYRKITKLLEREGFKRGFETVRRIRRKEGLQVPQKQIKKRRLWLKGRSCVRLKPVYKNHVWSYDFVSDRTHNGRSFRILNIIDEYTKECLCCHVGRRIRSQDVIFLLSCLFLEKGKPRYIRSDNGPEFIAKKLVVWLEGLEVKPLFISPGSPWENPYIESFNGKMRYEFLNGEMFYSLKEAKVLIEKWRREYNTIRPHSSLKGKPPLITGLKTNLKLANTELTM